MPLMRKLERNLITNTLICICRQTDLPPYMIPVQKPCLALTNALTYELENSAVDTQILTPRPAPEF